MEEEEEEVEAYGDQSAKLVSIISLSGALKQFHVHLAS